MKNFPLEVLAVFIGLLSCSMAAWHDYGFEIPNLASLASHAALKQSNQFYEQNAHGLYSYGYTAPHAAKQEVRSSDGVTRGFYSYVDGAGELQTVQYIADADGFHVAGTNLPRADAAATAALPQPVTETPEVAAARAQHLAAHAAAKLRNSVPQQSLTPLSKYGATSSTALQYLTSGRSIPSGKRSLVA